MQYQSIVYAIIKITRRGTTVPLYEFAAKQPEKEDKLSFKIFPIKIKSEYRNGPEKIQIKGRNENIRRLYILLQKSRGKDKTGRLPLI